MFRDAQVQKNIISPHIQSEIQLCVLRNRLFAKYKDNAELLDYITKISYEAQIYVNAPKSQATPISIPQDIREFAADLLAFRSTQLTEEQHQQLADKAQNTLVKI